MLQAQILDLLRELVAEDGMGLILISHDLGVVADMADRITILRHGEVQEAGETAAVLREQKHPYTRRLAEASVHVPKWANALTPPDGEKRLLELNDVARHFPGHRTGLFKRGEPTRAVDGVSFAVRSGHSVALVGQSGCGKSTLARMILALDRPTSGTITFDGMETSALDEDALRPARREMQVVFQDPYGSFDPRQKIGHSVAEPLHLMDKPLTRPERRERIAAAMEEVGMQPSDATKYPHEFSGGQRQRLAIARAIITRPKLVVADEPVSALDVSIRAQILDLFARLNDDLGLAFLFITHDLTVARAITHDVLVMDHERLSSQADRRCAGPSGPRGYPPVDRRRAGPAKGNRETVRRRQITAAKTATATANTVIARQKTATALSMSFSVTECRPATLRKGSSVIRRHNSAARRAPPRLPPPWRIRASRR